MMAVVFKRQFLEPLNSKSFCFVDEGVFFFFGVGWGIFLCPHEKQ